MEERTPPFAERIFKIRQQFLLLEKQNSKNYIEFGEFVWKSAKCQRTSVYFIQTNYPIYFIFTNVIANITTRKSLKLFLNPSTIFDSREQNV